MTQLRLSELCSVLGENGLEACVEGDDCLIGAVKTLSEAGRDDISFLSNPKYIEALRTTQAGAVIVRTGQAVRGGLPTIRCDDPYSAVTVAIATLHGYRQHPQWGRSPGAHIDPSAVIGASPNIAAGAFIAAGARIGDNCTIYPGCYVGDGAQVGDECTLYPNVVIYDGSWVGNRVTIHAGSIIGEDGLGYAPRDGAWMKIPMVGRAIIEDDVEIGANSAIDRGTLGPTRIGAGTKLGNLNVVGHGTSIGRDCMIVGQVGIAGSVTIGDRVIIKGQSGISGHLSIGDDAIIGPMSGVADSVEAGGNVFGIPATDFSQQRRSALSTRKLPDALRRLRALEVEMKALRKLLGED